MRELTIGPSGTESVSVFFIELRGFCPEYGWTSRVPGSQAGVIQWTLNFWAGGLLGLPSLSLCYHSWGEVWQEPSAEPLGCLARALPDSHRRAFLLYKNLICFFHPCPFWEQESAKEGRSGDIPRARLWLSPPVSLLPFVLARAELLGCKPSCRWFSSRRPAGPPWPAECLCSCLTAKTGSGRAVFIGISHSRLSSRPGLNSSAAFWRHPAMKWSLDKGQTRYLGRNPGPSSKNVQSSPVPTNRTTLQCSVYVGPVSGEEKKILNDINPPFTLKQVTSAS